MRPIAALREMTGEWRFDAGAAMRGGGFITRRLGPAGTAMSDKETRLQRRFSTTELLICARNTGGAAGAPEASAALAGTRWWGDLAATARPCGGMCMGGVGLHPRGPKTATDEVVQRIVQSSSVGEAPLLTENSQSGHIHITLHGTRKSTPPTGAKSAIAAAHPPRKCCSWLRLRQR